MEEIDELIETVRKNVSIDWTVKQSARVRMQVLVKRILRKYGYPPDLQEAATKTVLEQAGLLAAEWPGRTSRNRGNRDYFDYPQISQIRRLHR